MPSFLPSIWVVLQIAALALLCVVAAAAVTTTNLTIANPEIGQDFTSRRLRQDASAVLKMPHAFRHLQSLDELTDAAPELAQTAFELFIVSAVVLFGYKQYKKNTVGGARGQTFNYQDQYNQNQQQPGFAEQPGFEPGWDQQPGYAQPQQDPGLYYQEGAQAAPGMYGQPF